MLIVSTFVPSNPGSIARSFERLLSINPPSLTGKAGGSAQPNKKISWIHRQLADEEGQNGWPIGKPLIAHCGNGGQGFRPPATPPVMPPGLAGLTIDPPVTPAHGPIPEKHCSCGIYATTSIKVIDQYLGTEVVHGAYIRGPVLGVVEMGDLVIPAPQGFRAAAARVAAIILIDEAFTLSHFQLRQIAETYKVPALDDLFINPEDYREYLQVTTPLGDEVEEFLKGLGDGEDEG